MTRSVNTVATVLITLIALYVFGGDTLKNFAFSLIVGVTSGAYSSIFIASPMLVMWKAFADRKRSERRAAAAAAGPRTAAPRPAQRTAAAAAATAMPPKRVPPKPKRPSTPPPRYRRKREDVSASAPPNGASVGVIADGQDAADARDANVEPTDEG
jgi:hypothetical protein